MNDRFSGPDTVRDLRTLPYYVMDARITLEYLPILGGGCHALYSIYACLGQTKANSPGIRKLADVVRESTRRVQLNNKLLVWAGLIDIQSGGVDTPNVYILLDVGPVTEQLKRFIGEEAKHELGGVAWAKPFLRVLLRRLETSRGLYEPLVPVRQPREEELELLTRLEQLGFSEANARLMLQIAEETLPNPSNDLGGWLDYVESNKQVKAPAGFIRRKIELGETPPVIPKKEAIPSKYADLVKR